MKARLALFVALWVVFAPGWHVAEGDVDRATKDLAARVLAPSFDEGAVRDAQPSTFSKDLTGRQSKLPRHAFEAAALLCAALASIGRSHRLRVARSLFSRPAKSLARRRLRAPPLLRLA
jgi:hypothetical protein